ncbi:MAG: iron-containing alcohol dehydrogenase [Cyclobacteriaceae bacterium]
MKTLIRQFNFPTIIRFGQGATEEVPDHLKTEGFNRPLLVTDANTASISFFQNFLEHLNARRLQPQIFITSRFTPSEEQIHLVSEQMSKGETDCIVAIGSATALSIGRAAALFKNHPRPLSLYDDRHGGEKNITQAIPHFITIPVAGGGNEVSRSIEFRDTRQNCKSILFSPRLLAKIVFADPLATRELSAKRIREWQMESFAVLLEAWLSRMNHPICDGIACEGLSILLESKDTHSATPTIVQHQEILTASLMSGITRQKGLGALYALSDAVSQYGDCTLGSAYSILFPSIMRFYKESDEKKKLHKLACRLSWREKTNEAIVERLIGWAAHLSLPERLSEVGVHASDLETITELAWSDPAHADGIRTITKSEMRAILSECL